MSYVPPGDAAAQSPLAVQETPVQFLGREDSPGGGSGNPLVLLLGESHGQGSLAGCSPCGCKESDTTE